MNQGTGWELGSPQAFPDEARLHTLVAQNPSLLPLSGSPRLAVLGSEVLYLVCYSCPPPLSTSGGPTLTRATLDTRPTLRILAHSDGRPAIIEAKLGRNPEARRAIIAQVLAYAAFLRGMDVHSLENGALRLQLAEAGYGSVLEAVRGQDQEGALDETTFNNSLQQYLNEGGFRLVLLLVRYRRSWSGRSPT